MTEHLTTDEILNFVTLDNIGQDALNLVTRVNFHIMNCPECFKLVSAVQTVYEEFERLQNTEDFIQYVNENYLSVTDGQTKLIF